VERGNPVLRLKQLQAGKPQGRPTERREKEVGRSEGFRESRKIEPETWLKRQNRQASAPVNERADVQQVSLCERTGRTFEDEKANDG